MNKYLIKDIDVDINLECDDDIYYPTEIFKDTYIDADSPKQAFLEFVKSLRMISIVTDSMMHAMIWFGQLLTLIHWKRLVMELIFIARGTTSVSLTSQ